MKLSSIGAMKIMLLLLKCLNCRVAWYMETHMNKLWQMPKRRLIYGLIQPKNLAILYLPQKGRD
jgi:hypothetical protein